MESRAGEQSDDQRTIEKGWGVRDSVSLAPWMLSNEVCQPVPWMLSNDASRYLGCCQMMLAGTLDVVK